LARSSRQPVKLDALREWRLVRRSQSAGTIVGWRAIADRGRRFTIGPRAGELRGEAV
jgi:hypothetical protein